MIDEGEWFSPEKLTELRDAYFDIFSAIFFLPVVVFTLFLSSVAGIVAAGFLGGLGVFVFWYNRAFQKTAFYRFTEEEIQYKRGVWIKKQSSVPYNRITNAESGQGPVQRFFDAGGVKVHTAGQGTPQAEMNFGGVENFKEIEEKVMEKVREKKPQAIESLNIDAEGSENSEIVQELQKIRKILEED